MRHLHSCPRPSSLFPPVWMGPHSDLVFTSVRSDQVTLSTAKYKSSHLDWRVFFRCVRLLGHRWYDNDVAPNKIVIFSFGFSRGTVGFWGDRYDPVLSTGVLPNSLPVVVRYSGWTWTWSLSQVENLPQHRHCLQITNTKVRNQFSDWWGRKSIPICGFSVWRLRCMKFSHIWT